VDEQVGDLDPAPGALEALGLGDVADLQLDPRFLQVPCPRSVADKGADRRAGLAQRGEQAATDEPRCSGDQDPGGDLSRLPDGTRLQR
jgi:hypothetical protein